MHAETAAPLRPVLVIHSGSSADSFRVARILIELLLIGGFPELGPAIHILESSIT